MKTVYPTDPILNFNDWLKYIRVESRVVKIEVKQNLFVDAVKNILDPDVFRKEINITFVSNTH